MNFIWDTRRNARISITRQGLEIRRGCLVTGIPVTDGVTGSDPEVLIKILGDSQCPIVGISLYPSSTAPFNYAILDEISPTNEPTMTASQARVEFIYRVSRQPQDWSLTDGGQGSYIECYTTSSGTTAISVWYKKQQTTAQHSPPASAPGNMTYQTLVRGIHKFYPQRTIRASAQMLGPAWNSVKTAIRAASGSICSSQWGPSSADSRGTWLFLFPTSTTTDYGRTYRIELNFIQDSKGHFPIGYYYNRFGEHPVDGFNPESLDAVLGLPAFDTIQQMSGIVRASIYKETDFNGLFSFNPST